jgi:hypothetical protein
MRKRRGLKAKIGFLLILLLAAVLLLGWLFVPFMAEWISPKPV